jgi:hypothetical protein
MKSSEPRTLILPHFVAFVWQYLPLRLSSLLAARRRQLGLGQFGCGCSRATLTTENVRVSQVPGESSCAFAPAFDPGKIVTPRLDDAIDSAPACFDREGSCIQFYFEARSRSFSTRCLRFAPPVARTGRKTHFRPLARLCRVGFATHRTRTKGFRDASYISFPLPQALPGAPKRKNSNSR